ncbi:MAG: hypothetical protein HYX39_09210 [Bacteroidetes bacterium]|nr:hypothetical protein [Bacteroidota bacterium]
MDNLKILFAVLILIFFSACGALKDTANDGLPEGKYNSKLFKSKKVYVTNSGDSLIVYNLQNVNKNHQIDTNNYSLKIFPSHSKEKIESHTFNATTFDFDALAIPFKYRPLTNSLPQQFTTSLNGAVYFGFRNDNYQLKYENNYFNYHRRETRHYGISVGGFAGFGSSPVNTWVTSNNIKLDYEGVVFTKGIAVIMAIGKFTSGFAIGWDNLLDKNKQHWIYENKPWFGLVFGLNLN